MITAVVTDKIEADYQPGGVTNQKHREFVVIAEDENGTERVLQVLASNHEAAVRAYQKRYDYTVTGVALLGGSGHPLHRV